MNKAKKQIDSFTHISNELHRHFNKTLVMPDKSFYVRSAILHEKRTRQYLKFCNKFESFLDLEAGHNE